MTKKKPKATTSTQTTNPSVGVAASSNTLKHSGRNLDPSPAPAFQKALNGQSRSRTVFTAPSTLLICRNKYDHSSINHSWRLADNKIRHTKNISSYSGPWLSLPPEVLDTYCHSNYYSPRPRPIDPAVFFDLVKIRRLIEDATSLAVRAANGTASSSLHTSLNAANGILNGSDAEILGIGSARGGGDAKLSRERKHRMREHATQKLAHAYRLDEIASSVAMMQSASALEDVAKHVLQRDEQNVDAIYVHHHHEKIPSMAVAEYTSLDPLTEVIRQIPTDPSALRTRAVTRTFMDDFEGVVRDCTEGLTVHRMFHAQPLTDQRDLILAKDAAKVGREPRSGARLEEKDHPSSLEPQLLFHRAGAYLTLACENIGRALYGSRGGGASQHNGTGTAASLEEEQNKARADSRKLVRTNAKRALRDYLAFLSHLDYTPGLSAEYTDAFLQRVGSGAPHGNGDDRLLGISSHMDAGLSEALVKYERQNQSPNMPQIPKPAIYQLKDLFAAVPPADVLPHPSEQDTTSEQGYPAFSLPDFSEAVTYHPLLTDVLHSVLLCHCLIQTSTKELRRHAYMTARVARICDGYSIFTAARSPARADWIEVLRRTNNWVGLASTWETLCTPAPAPGNQSPRHNTAEIRQTRIKREALIEALADERGLDEESFTANLKARELRAAREEEDVARKEYNRTKLIDATATDQNDTKDGISSSLPPRWAQVEGKEYPITTDRAEALVRWILEAPSPSSSDGASRPRKKAGPKGRLRKQNSTASSLREATETGLEQSVESLDLD